MAYLAAARSAHTRAKDKEKHHGDKNRGHRKDRSTDSKDNVVLHGPQKLNFESDAGTMRELNRSQTGHVYDMPKLQWKVKECYTNSKTEVLVAVLIGVNFVISICKFQICPLDTGGNLYCYGDSKDTKCMLGTCQFKEDTCWDLQSEPVPGWSTTEASCTEEKGTFFFADEEVMEIKNEKRLPENECIASGHTWIDKDVKADSRCGKDVPIKHDDWKKKGDGSDWLENCQSTIFSDTKQRAGVCTSGIMHQTFVDRNVELPWDTKEMCVGSDPARHNIKGDIQFTACFEDGAAVADPMGSYSSEYGCESADFEWRSWHPPCTGIDDVSEFYYGYVITKGEDSCGSQTSCESAGYTWECEEHITESDIMFKGLKIPNTACTPAGVIALSGTHSTFFFAAECFFAIAFGIELIINMTAHTGRCCKKIYIMDESGRCPTSTLREDDCTCNSRDWYWREFFCGPNRGWNIFDFVIVIISILSVVLPPGQIPGMGILRLFRAFRVFRLFARLGELKKIITAMERALPGVGSASLVLILVIMIFAILGVEFFRLTPDKYLLGSKYGWVCSLDQTKYDASDPNLNFNGSEPTGSCKFKDPNSWGEEYFGSFLKAMFTLFQVLTGESWAEAVARPATIHFWPSAIFFIFFVLICGYILINVVIAVLLDKMMTYEPDEEDKDQEEETMVSCPECFGKGNLVGDQLEEIMCSRCKGNGQVEMNSLFTDEYITKEAKRTMKEVTNMADRLTHQMDRLYKHHGIQPAPDKFVEEEEPAAAGAHPNSQDVHKPAYDDQS